MWTMFVFLGRWIARVLVTYRTRVLVMGSSRTRLLVMVWWWGWWKAMVVLMTIVMVVMVVMMMSMGIGPSQSPLIRFIRWIRMHGANRGTIIIMDRRSLRSWCMRFWRWCRVMRCFLMVGTRGWTIGTYTAAAVVGRLNSWYVNNFLRIEDGGVYWTRWCNRVYQGLLAKTGECDALQLYLQTQILKFLLPYFGFFLPYVFACERGVQYIDERGYTYKTGSGGGILLLV